MTEQAYAKTPTNTVKRLGNRGHYDFETIHTIINKCPVLHVSFNDPDNPFPVVLPMIGCTGDFTNQNVDAAASPQDIYIHGYVSARLFRCGGAAKDQDDQGLPITVAATYLDGLVLSLTPFHNSCNYRSAVCYGYATLVPPSSPEGLYAMQKITNNMVPERWERSRIPPTKAELDSTSILKVRIVSASAKVRVGGPSEDRNDLKNSELKERVWTGVVPVWQMWGDPVPGKENGREEVEEYIEKWRLEENRRAKTEAFGAVEKVEK
ncbi:5-nitroimidazole antibiotic resistance protein [Sporormia fimetaria CBS 119925]|uniref:5-nitroimidazole antibiotic resistance protein n=1 Tax=Sporormia fimetaria CBS 119925 TaxID=1340428 RepID=A0A6A6V5C1_9PLEO|nr:5-nitroimidazole antibiotic resistance protein [Sporormia fimetaria CBS 119925]